MEITTIVVMMMREEKTWTNFFIIIKLKTLYFRIQGFFVIRRNEYNSNYFTVY